MMKFTSMRGEKSPLTSSCYHFFLNVLILSSIFFSRPWIPWVTFVWFMGWSWLALFITCRLKKDGGMLKGGVLKLFV